MLKYEKVIDTLEHPILKLESDRNALVLIRGLAGSGKSTLARIMLAMSSPKITTYKYEAAAFFLQQDGSYRYNRKFIKLAHQFCLSNTIRGLQSKHSHVIVSNNFTMNHTLHHYLEEAYRYKRSVRIICAKGAYEPTLQYSPEEIEWIRASFEQNPDEYEFRMHFNEDVSDYDKVVEMITSKTK